VEDRVTSPNRATWIYATEMNRSSRSPRLSPVIPSTYHAHANSSWVPHRSTNWISQSTHRKTQKLMLRSLNPAFLFSTATKELRLAELELARWAAHQQTEVATAYTYLDLDINPALRPSERQQIAKINQEFQSVFLVTKGNVPTPADHPPVHLNFLPDWKHVSVPIPNWGRGEAQVLEQWARKQLRSGLFERSKSPPASRPHIVRKPPHDAPKDVDIIRCDFRICGDYRRPNEQLQKSHPTSANGTDELQKLPGYSFY
jgi:hypothetical protein